jgi:dTMP kinase
MNKGFFISFEGGEGCGKTTQVNRLAKCLTALGHKVVTTREPGGTPEAETIRDLIVQRNTGAWAPFEECLLLYAARLSHVDTVIKPALAKGKIVISDRFIDSTLAYQGYGRGADIKKIEALNDLVLGGFKPDMTFIMDIDPKIGLARSNRRLAAEELKLKQSEDRFESMEMEFHERLRRGFLDIAKSNPDRCHLIDASRDLDVIESEIMGIVGGRIK